MGWIASAPARMPVSVRCFETASAATIDSAAEVKVADRAKGVTKSRGE